jgi:hypothetical protein
MQDLFAGFVEFIRSFLTPFGLGNYAQVVALIPFLILLYVVYLIVMRMVTLTFRKARMPAEAT